MERAKVRKVVSGRAWRTVCVLAAALLCLMAVGVAGARAEEAARIDLNVASAAELESLPGVGPAKAQAIIAHRETAPFKNAEELIEVKGIGEKLFAQLKDKVTVSAAAGAATRAKGQGEPVAAAPADGKAGRTASASGTR